MIGRWTFHSDISDRDRDRTQRIRECEAAITRLEGEIAEAKTLLTSHRKHLKQLRSRGPVPHGDHTT